MPQQAQQLDLTSLLAVLNAMSQVLGANGKALTSLLNNGATGAKSAHISGAGTFAFSGSAGILFSMNINTPAIGATATIYDSAAGLTNSIGTFTLAGSVASYVPIGPPERGVALNNGLVVVTTGAADILLGHF